MLSRYDIIRLYLPVKYEIAIYETYMAANLGRLSRLGFSSIPECLFVAPREYRDCLEPINILPIPDTGIKHYMLLTLTEQVMYERSGEVTDPRRFCDRATNDSCGVPGWLHPS